MIFMIFFCLGCAFGDRWGEATITCQKEQTNGSNELDVHIYNSRPARRTCRIVHRVSLVGTSCHLPPGRVFFLAQDVKNFPGTSKPR